MERFDAIIIGSGQAANPLAKRLSKVGRRVAVVESGNFGGTCISSGCTPAKTLAGVAKSIYRARRVDRLGIRTISDLSDYLNLK